jgi:hypothetical protein
MSLKSYLEEISRNFYIDFAEYVGANISFNVNQYSSNLEKYKKRYTCYRFWQEINEKTALDFIIGKINSIQIRLRQYYACARNIDNIKQMIDEDEIIDFGLISKHEGNGISVLEILKSGIQVVTDQDDLRYIKEVYIHNKHQDEILFFDPITRLDNDNVVAYVNEKERIIIPI